MGSQQRRTTQPLEPIERKPDMQLAHWILACALLTLAVCALIYLTRNL